MVASSRGRGLTSRQRSFYRKQYSHTFPFAIVGTPVKSTKWYWAALMIQKSPLDDKLGGTRPAPRIDQSPHSPALIVFWKARRGRSRRALHFRCRRRRETHRRIGLRSRRTRRRYYRRSGRRPAGTCAFGRTTLPVRLVVLIVTRGRPRCRRGHLRSPQVLL